MFNLIKPLECPSCNVKDHQLLIRKLINREQSKWNQRSSYHVWFCKNCSTNSKVSNLPKLAFLFTIAFLFGLVAYQAIVSYSKLFANIGMFISAIPVLIFALNSIKLERDA
jgi:hypothetical protein